MKIAHSIRELLRSPISTLTIVVSLALGIGANLAVFSALYSVLLKPLPYPDPDRLVALYESTTDKGTRPVALANLVDWQDQSTRFEAMAAYLKRSFGFEVGQAPASQPASVVQIGMVTAGFFKTLGTTPALGRTFSADEEGAATPVIVISDRLWRDELRSGDDAIGATVRLNDFAYTVIGVLPAGFSFQSDGVTLDAYIPISHKDYGWSRGVRSLGAIARLKPGITMGQARTELQSIAARLAESYPEDAGCSADLTSLHEAMEGKNRRPLLLLMGAAALLLIIACANVASILLARALAGARDVSVMIALGARARHLAKRFITDGALLSATGAVCGLLLARVIVAALRFGLAGVTGPSLPGSSLFIQRAAMAGDSIIPVLALGIFIGIAITIVFGALPLLVARKFDLYQLMSGSMTQIGARRNLYRAMVAAQIGLCAVLLMFSGLLIKSFYNLVNLDPGFKAGDVLEFGIGLPEKRYPNDEKLIAFHKQLLERLSALPGVESAGAVGRLPLAGRPFGTTFEPEGASMPAQQRPAAQINPVSPDYFHTMNVPLVSGREFDWTDTLSSPRVIMVNQAFARSQSPDDAPERAFSQIIGRRLRLGWSSDATPKDSLWQIVGIAGDVRQVSLDQPAGPEIFLPMSQFGVDGCGYVLKTRRGPAELHEAITHEVWALDDRLEDVQVRQLDSFLAQGLMGRKILLSLTVAFAALATILTAVGIYGIMSFSAVQRRTEFGIRAALGARSTQILALVVRQGLQMAVAGTIAGLICFQAIARVVTSNLYGVKATDPATNLAVAAGLICVAIAACAVPAWRASQCSPSEVIKKG